MSGSHGGGGGQPFAVFIINQIIGFEQLPVLLCTAHIYTTGDGAEPKLDQLKLSLLAVAT